MKKRLFSEITFAITETSSGTIYAGDLSNIARYNESTRLFENINLHMENPHLCKTPITWYLYEDKNGIIWICNYNGLYTYDPKNGSAKEINLFKKRSGRGRANFVTGIWQDKNGLMWVSTFQGIYRYNVKTHEAYKIKKSELPASVDSTMCTYIYHDKFGILWVGTFENGLLKLDFTKEPIRLYPNPVSGFSNSGWVINSFYNSSKDYNTAWLGTYKGLVKYNLADKTFKMFQHKDGKPNSLPNNYVTGILPRDPDHFWLGTYNGISLMNHLNNTFTNYTLKISTKYYSINYNIIFDLAMDAQDNLWTASGPEGVTRFDTKNKTYKFIPTIRYRTYNLKLLNFIDSLNTKVKALEKIVKVGNSRNLKKEFTVEKQTRVMLVAAGEATYDPNSLLDKGWLINEKSDTVWNQTYLKSFYMGGLNINRINLSIIILNKGKYTLRYKSDESYSYGNWGPTAGKYQNASPPPDSTLWGIQVFQIPGADADYYKKLINEDNKDPFIYSDYVLKVLCEGDSAVLIGTGNGLFKYNINKNAVYNLQKDANIKFTPDSKDISDMLADSNNVVWLATFGGLIRYDQNSKQFKAFYDKDGLPSNSIDEIEEDNYGNLWLGTDAGISEFNKDIEHPLFNNYGVKDGLQGYKYWGGSFKNKNGELFFAGLNGFNVFKPGKINRQLPDIDITQFKISNEVVHPASKNSPLTKSILDTKQITLAYDQNNISFDFAAIHFSSPSKNKYAYRLDGFDKKGWIYDNRRFANYTNLPPGHYVFRVIGSNSDGIWNKTGASIKITILSPWWRTWWAYTFYIFAFVGILGGARKFELDRRKEKENKRILQLENKRKTEELEEARKLQLSMLPRDVPQLPNLDIAVYMQTATEVGGDYYDFAVGLDGTLNIALGDATGHGMQAGTLVTIMKGIFTLEAGKSDVIPFFNKSVEAIKEIKLGRLMMAFVFLKIKDSQLSLANAGVPPVYIYRKEKNEVEEIDNKGMPLGAISNYPYKETKTELNKGDVIFLLSDGFPELSNNKKEVYGYERVKNIFKDVSGYSAEEIIEKLKNAVGDWSGGKVPEDDVTFVVIKMK